MTQTDGEIHHVLGLNESILWKWLYYPKHSTDSGQSLSNYQSIFRRQQQQQQITFCMETQKTLNSAKHQ